MRKCDICGASLVVHSCYRCEKNMCSSCTDEQGPLCKNCSIKDDDIEGIQIGFTPMKKVVNLPLFLTGITILIIGMVIMM